MALAAAACSGPGVAASEVIDVPPIAKSETPTKARWVGQWRTNWGTLDLVQDGAKILGSFSYKWEGEERVGILVGKPNGNYLDFKWSEQKGADKGRGTLVIAEDGSKFSGHYGYDESCDDAGPWSGIRVREELLGF